MSRKKKTNQFHRVVMANHKGGTGKTTLSYIEAVGLAMRGYSVCVMDYDPQCNTSSLLLDMEVDARNAEWMTPPPHPDYDPAAAQTDENALPSPRPSTGTLLYHGWTHEYATRWENLTIVPGDYKLLMEIEAVTVPSTLDALYKDARTALLDEPYWRENYDVIVMDTGPNKGPITTCAIQMASHIIIPIRLEELSVQGLRGMLAYWTRQNLTRPASEKIDLIGIQCNMVDSSKRAMNKFYLEQITENEILAPYLLPTQIHNWQAYSEMTIRGFKHVLELSPNNPARVEAEAMVDSVESALFGTAGGK